MRYGKLVFFGMLVCSIFGSLPTYAVTYSQDATVRFTFNSELNVVIDDADIEILDLAPGTSSDSNVVGITISTNNMVGYTASATVGNATYNTTSMTNDNNDTFTSISTDASEASLSTDNTWGYTTSLDNGSSWANLSGLPIYTGTPKEIAKTTSPANDAIKFKINAKAATSQAAGDYKNVINFTVVANVPPRTFEDILGSNPIIQDVTEEVCDAVEAIDDQSRLMDSRDGKLYYVAKLRDGHCWMTQNLDLNIDSSKTYTNNDTDLGWNGAVYTTASWQPERSTIPADQVDNNGYITGWQHDYNNPYSFDADDWYWTGTWYSSTENDFTVGQEGNRFQKDAPFITNGEHGHVGNYYNFAASIASNDASSYTGSTYDSPASSPQNSICPKNWRLPHASSLRNYNEFYNLLNSYNAYTSQDDKLISTPMYFVRSGFIDSDNDLRNAGYEGFYRASTVNSSSNSYALDFYSDWMSPGYYRDRGEGWSIRCVARYLPIITLQFNNNNGSGSMSNQEIKSGKTAVLSQNQFTRSGYKFMGWNTEADGSGIGYGDGDSYTAPSDSSVTSVTLYAQWEEDAGGQGGGGYQGRTLARAYEEAYMYNSGSFDGHHGMYVPEKDNQGNYTGRYFEADSEDDYLGIPARDLRFAMQDADLLVDGEKICERASVVGSEVHLIDLRDFKSYWAVKLKDGHCWMSQNLDFDVSGPLTSLDSDINDIGIGGYTTSTGYSQSGSVITWTPIITTSTPNANGTATWANGTEYGYSLDPGNWYMDGSTSNTHLADNFLSTGGTRGYVRKDYPYDTIGTHGHVGNYYAYATAIATNHVSSYLNMDAYNDSSKAPNNSICPKNWRLAVESSQTKEYSDLINLYDATITSHPDRLVNAPMYYIESGIFLGSQDLVGVYGIYLSSVYHYDGSRNMGFGLEIGFSNNVVRTELVNYTGANHGPGKSVRCLMR